MNCTSLLCMFCWVYDLLNASAVAVEFGPILLSAQNIILFLCFSPLSIECYLSFFRDLFLNFLKSLSTCFAFLFTSSLRIWVQNNAIWKNVKTGKKYIQVYCQMNETLKFKLTHFIVKFSNKLSQFLLLFNCIFTNLDFNF